MLKPLLFLTLFCVLCSLGAKKPTYTQKKAIIAAQKQQQASINALICVGGV